MDEKKEQLEVPAQAMGGPHGLSMQTPAPDAAGPQGQAADTTTAAIEEAVVAQLRTVFDPEIPVNIYELGLIYDIKVEEAGDVAIKMTLTAPGCPVAGEMPGMVELAARRVEAVASCDVELVWDPPWNPDMMTEEAKLTLNI